MSFLPSVPRARLRSRGVSIPASVVLVAAALLSSVAPVAMAAEAIAVGGRVVADGRPVAGAQVELVPVESRYAEALRRLAGDPVEVASSAGTGEDGRFELVAPGPGMWSLVVSRPGSVPLAAALAPLTGEQVLQDAPLERDLGLAVRVVDPGGRPIPGAEVRVREAFLEELRWSPADWDVADRRGRADDGGRLHLPRRAGEGLVLSAWASGKVEAEARVEPGARGEVTIVLAPGVARQLTVRHDGTPVPHVVVRVGRTGWPVAVTGEDGTATLLLPAAEPTPLQLDAGGGWRTPPVDLPPPAEPPAPPPAVEGAPAVAGAETAPVPAAPLALELPPTWSAVGVVTAADDDAPLAGALVWPADERGELVRTDARGGFRLVRVEREEVRVRAAAPGYHQASQPVVPRQRELARLVLEPSVAVVGTVVDVGGRPLAGAEVRLRRDAERWRPWTDDPRVMGGPVERTWSDAAGRFRFGARGRGELVELHAVADGYAPGSVQAEAGQPPLLLVLEEGREVRGRLIGEQGEPVAGARVGLAWVPEQRAWTMIIAENRQVLDFETVSDAEGRFVLADLPAGTYDGVIDGRPLRALHQVPGLRVPAEGGVDLGEIVLRPAVGLDLLVIDRGGSPIAGAQAWRSWSTEGSRADGVSVHGGDALGTSDAEGRLRLEGLTPEEPITLSIQHEGYRPARLPGIAPPRDGAVEVVLERGLSLSGQVVTADGAAAPGASVTLIQEWRMAHSEGSHSMSAHRGSRADDEGRFVFDGLEAAQRVELAARWQGQSGSLELTDLPESGTLGPIELRLEAAPRVLGTVRLPEGEPAAGATVILWQEGDLPGHRPHEHRATADALGRFDVTTRFSGPARLDATRDELAASREVVLAPGPLEVELTLEAPDGPGVRGRVVDGEGLPVAQARVTAACREDCEDSEGRVTDERGEFLFRELAPGSYVLRATFEGLAPAERALDLTGGWVDGVELVLRRGGSIEGTLSGVDPRHLAAVAVDATDGERRLRGTVDHRGIYRIPGASPGVWRVTARSEAAGRSAEGEVELLEMDDAARLDLELEVSGVRLSGRVTLDGEPASGLELALAPEGAPQAAIAHTRTAFDGSFQFAGVEPGRYRLEVRGNLRVPPSARVVDLPDDRQIALDLTVAVVEGRVLLADGSSAADVRVALAAASGGELYATVEPDGRFRFPAVGAGSYVLSARRGDAVLASQPVVIGPLDVAGLLLVVERPGG